MVQCLKWMKNCIGQNNLSISIIIINLVLIGALLVTAIITIILLSSIFKKSPVKIDLNRNKFVSSFIIVSMVFRIFYWIQSYWKFQPNSFPSVIQIVFSLTSMLFMYLSQSVFVKSWLLNFQKKSSQKTISMINRTFWIIDSILVIFMVIAIFFNMFDDQTVENGVFSKIASLIITFSSFINSLSFLIIGLIISVKISTQLSCCQRQVFKFIFASLILTLSAVFRCVTFFFYVYDRQKLNEDMIQMLIFFIPEFIPACVIIGTQIELYRNEKEFMLKYLQETMLLIEERT
ncbi:Transmembrane_domain-containing protein [Hexamita inflata]|uniref:Transmembrane domain-containing protein n=1 Tax=Hexamita inflata TaxID=28002 RepID=A0AA86QV21_9EUKA|nr:Transmembrane domain-containing protein [Hexamita inflata]